MDRQPVPEDIRPGRHGESADAADQERAAYSFGVWAGQIQQSYPPG